MGYQPETPPSGEDHRWSRNYAADQQNLVQWSHDRYQRPGNTGEFAQQQPYGPAAGPAGQFPAPNPQPRKRSRAMVAGFGVAAIALAGGGAATMAFIDHVDKPAATQLPMPKGMQQHPQASAPTQPSIAAPVGSVEQVSAKVLPSVVKLQIKTGQGSEEGSGIVLSPDGLILTNNHVVAAAAQGSGRQAPQASAPDGQVPKLPRGMFPGGQMPDLPPGLLPGDGSDSQDPYDGPSTAPSARARSAVDATVTMSDGRSVPFTVVGTDPDDDIAVVKAQNVSGLTPIAIGSSKDLKVGQNVVAIGSPLGLQGTVTTGIVSALDRPVSTGDGDTGQHSVMSAIQTDAAINPGNSGGALVDMDGKLIGVNSAIASLGQDSQGAQSGSIGLGFAIPVDQAKRIADQLIAGGTVQHASLGVQLAANSKANGAAVAAVADGSAAAAAGLPKGAVITKVDDHVIDGPDALVAAVRSKSPGDNVAVTYNDASGTSHTVQVTLGQAPQS